MPSLATIFCSSFPLFMFHFIFLSSSMKNGETFHYKGERSREAMVDYAERMALPPIQAIGESSTMKAKIKSKQSFFLYVGDYEGSLWVIVEKTLHASVPVMFAFTLSHRKRSTRRLMNSSHSYTFIPYHRLCCARAT